MKKMLAWCLLLGLLFTSGTAWAADAGVVVILGPVTEPGFVSLDDMKLNETAEIPGYAEVTLTEFNFVDKFSGYFRMSWGTADEEFESENDADFALVYMIVVNKSNKGVRFLDEINDIVFTYTYTDEYKYVGFAYRCNQNLEYPKYPIITKDKDEIEYIEKNYPETYTIKPMFEGHYLIGGTLPNAVVNGKGTLYVTFKLGGNELTYHIRK